MLTFSLHNLTIYQFSRKNPSLAQFILGIYNKNSRVFLGSYIGLRLREEKKLVILLYAIKDFGDQEEEERRKKRKEKY